MKPQPQAPGRAAPSAGVWLWRAAASGHLSSLWAGLAIPPPPAFPGGSWPGKAAWTGREPSRTQTWVPVPLTPPTKPRVGAVWAVLTGQLSPGSLAWHCPCDHAGTLSRAARPSSEDQSPVRPRCPALPGSSELRSPRGEWTGAVRGPRWQSLSRDPSLFPAPTVRGPRELSHLQAFLVCGGDVTEHPATCGGTVAGAPSLGAASPRPALCHPGGGCTWGVWWIPLWGRHPVLGAGRAWRVLWSGGPWAPAAGGSALARWPVRGWLQW